MIRFSSAARRTLPLVALFVVFGIFSARPAFAGGVVGAGNPASCTESAFNTALGGGGNVTFNCGPNPIVIVLSAYKQISSNTTIDGGNKITLDALNNNHFQVFSGRTLTLKNLRLTGGLGNSAGSIENFGVLKTNYVTFHKNESLGEGGAISNYGTLNLNHTTFTKNKAANGGGAIWNSGGNAKVKNSRFKGNKATGGGGTGGAIANDAGDVSVNGSDFIKNHANSGGAFWSQFNSTNSIKNSMLRNNAADTGAGITNFGGLQLVLDTIAGNNAVSQGGGIFHGGFLSIDASTIRGNHAATGGGMRHFGNSLFIQKSTFSGNGSTGDGAAVYSTADAEIHNSTFSGNNAGAINGGGGWFQSRNTALFKFVTFAGNVAGYGSGVYADGASPIPSEIQLQNTVVSNNVGGNCDGATITSLGYNISSDSNCGAFTQPGDKKNKNANLGPLANNGGPTLTHLPLFPSPLVNKGLNDAGILTDQRNAPRPVGPKSDIGAVELQ